MRKCYQECEKQELRHVILKIGARDENINIKYNTKYPDLYSEYGSRRPSNTITQFFSSLKNVTLTGGGGGGKSGNTTQNTAVVWP